ncbi:MAG: UPF0149 family protein [Pseudomonadota bacterium]
MSIDLHEKALSASAVIHPAELHGLTCGMAAGNPGKFSLPDFIALAGADSLADEHTVTDFVTQTLLAFAAQDMEFSPLVASDDEPLTERLTGLSHWCAGFLSGFAAALPDMAEGGSAQGDTMSTLPEDVQEIVRDFASISRLDDEPDGDEQDESSFMEIFEYTRVAAVLILALMSPEEGANADPDSAQDPDSDFDRVH